MAPVNPPDESQADDLDSPWKEALERYFEPFLGLLFPEAHSGIDWSRGYEFLESEFRAALPDAAVSRRTVDKLAKVWTEEGEEAWVLVHVEVQSQALAEFPRNMYIYNYRIFDRYDREVCSLGVLGDTRRSWRPDRWSYRRWGCEPGIVFPIVKLLDFEERWEELEQSDNPFAAVVMAHLRTVSTRRRPESRRQWKLRIVRSLYEQGFQREQIIELFRFIDWMMKLPEELERSFLQDVREFEQEKRMPYVTSVERLGFEQGERSAERRGVLDALEMRFGRIPDGVRKDVEAENDPTRLRLLHRRAIVVDSLERFENELSSGS